MKKSKHNFLNLILFSLMIAVLIFLLWKIQRQKIQPWTVVNVTPAITNVQPEDITATIPVETPPPAPSTHRLLPPGCRTLDPALTSLLITAETQLRRDAGPLVRQAGNEFLSYQAPFIAQIDAPDYQPVFITITEDALAAINLDDPRTDFSPLSAIVRGLLCTAWLAAESGNPDTALARIHTAFALAHTIAVDGGKGPRLQGYQLYLRLMRLSLSSLRLIAAEHPDPARLTTESWIIFEHIASHEVTLAEVAHFQQKFQSLLLINGPDPDLPGLPPLLKEAYDFPFIRRNLELMRTRARPLLDERYTLLIKILEDDAADQTGKIQAFKRENEENWTRSLIRRKDHPEEYFAWSIILAFIPDFSSLIEDRDSWRMERDATLGYLELISHLRRGGPLPTDLDALPGGTDLPHDICSPEGAPFRLIHKAGRLRLYGNGFNLRDDHGVPGLDFVIDLPAATITATEK